MPSRRTLLTGTATAAATALAGCSGGGSGQAVVQSDTPTPPADTTVVATDGAFRDVPPPNGAFRLSATAYERERGDRTELYLLTDHRLIPGENQHARNGWRLAELAVEHDYEDALVVDTRTNFRPVEPGETASVRLGRTAADATRRWTFRFPDTGDSTWGVTVATELDSETTPREGDTLAGVRVRVRETKQWSGSTNETVLDADLVYGQDD
jgi:hypothetical protein